MKFARPYMREKIMKCGFGLSKISRFSNPTIFMSVVILLLWCQSVFADITVTVNGPGGKASQMLPDAGGAFELNMPLNRNTVNSITVTAEDENGNSASKELAITQVSLDAIVVSKVTSERLSVEEVEQLVNDGVIDIEDPENYNVSTFDIVLTIDEKPVPISVPIAVPIEEDEEIGFENIRIPAGGGSGGKPKTPPVQIVVFEQAIPSASGPGEPSPPPIPGVIIIEGNIKSLKEFFNVRLLLMNTSGIFTLTDVTAEIELPDGKLSNVLPKDGMIAFNNILPGDGDLPGQKEKEFIIRGDEMGIHDVTVSFGGTVTGPGISEPIPFNGSATTEVEVKGPPTLQVQVTHPDTVTAGEPYELLVDITNTGELTAMFASLDLDVGADAQLAECNLNDSQEPVCEYIDGPAVRNFGHIEPGETVSESFAILPLSSGPIGSCMAASDQNITLQVLVGNMGCIVGQYPPQQGVPSGVPTVTVVPAPNVFGIAETSPVTAFFSERMNEGTIQTGENGSFNVFDNAGDIVPGSIRFEILNADTDLEKTVAIWQVDDGVTNRFASDEDYTVIITTDIMDQDGENLFNSWQSSFKTTTSGINDVTPPTVTLSIAYPVNPNYVLPGEIIKINTYASDMGSGISRVEMRLKDLDTAEAVYELIGQKTVFNGDAPPYIFPVDSAKLIPGHVYQAMATAYDVMGNAQNGTISLIIAASAAPPTVDLSEELAEEVLQGISISLTPEVTGGVNEVRYYLDAGTLPYKIVALHPFKATLSTLSLALGSHSIRVVAIDGLGQTGEGTYTFSLIENVNLPEVGFGASVDGAQYVTGDSILISGSAEDPVGIASLQYFLDDPESDPIYTGSAPILLNTTGLELGEHAIYLLATNKLGVSNEISHPESYLTFSVVEAPPGPPPDSPVVTNLSYPEAGMVTVTGTTVAGSRVDILNSNQGISVSVYGNAGGTFTGEIPADAEDELHLIAYDFSASPDPSDETVVTVLAAPVLAYITLSPENISFDAENATQQITVTGHYEGGVTADLTVMAGFSSNAPDVAAVNNSGMVVALKRGTAEVTVSVNGHSASIAVNCNIIKMTHITVSPETVVLAFIGDTQTLTATGYYNDGSSQTLTENVVYGLGNTGIVSIDSSGAITAIADGGCTINVYTEDVPGVSVPVEVDLSLDTVPEIQILSPANNASVEEGDIVSVSVQATDSVGGITGLYIESSVETMYSDYHQVSPPALSITHPFAFSVANDAVVGGVIPVTVWAIDGSGNTSTLSEITLRVVDETAPAVTISQPDQQAPYNFGDTVEIVIEAEDASDLNEIRFETIGSISESGSQTVSSTDSASVSFSFDVPYGLADPELEIYAYATDIYGNEGMAIPVTIILTDADITPPATIAVEVTDPETSTNTTISYEVLDGMDDLDHIELYFRRNGIGTFNRYTNADAGNPEGHFYPQDGNQGTLVFDSEKMGGDGDYEFYTVGVDIAGNRELAPDNGVGNVLPDETQSFNAGTVWTVINSSVSISDTDASYDNNNLKITGTGVVVTMDGSHTFHNVEILDGAVLTHSETTTTDAYALNFSAWTLCVDDQSRIDVTAKGYLGGNSSGLGETAHTVDFSAGAQAGNGGSYGGLGGHYTGSDTHQPNPVYGDLTNPMDLGSGGGGYAGAGGDGGGRILINTINTMVDGTICANGGLSSGSASGEGSGGAINVTSLTLSGNGVISVDGGTTNGANHTGGGGGRIAVRYMDFSTFDMTRMTAQGGDGYYGDGADGTIFLLREGQANGRLVINGQGVGSTFTDLLLPAGYTFDDIILQNNARVVAQSPIEVTNSLQISGSSILTHAVTDTDGIQITARRVEVEAGSAIDVTGKGYAGGNLSGFGETAATLDNVAGSANGCGGSYGGQGARFNGSSGHPNRVYGNPAQPDLLGSGGGAYSGNGGHGGGYVHIIASQAVVVDGNILANGGISSGSASGEGSGGSVWIETSELSGNGFISANGGTTNGSIHTSGGGGRVAIYLDYVNPNSDLNDLRNVTAFSGLGQYDNTPSAAGTVFVQYSNQNSGNLIVDDNVSGSTALGGTRLPLIGPGIISAVTSSSMTGDGNVIWPVNGLVSLRINPDENQNETFLIVSNTADTLIVDTPNENGTIFSDVAAVDGAYAGEFTFNNILFRRGGNLEAGDRLNVVGTINIAEYGMLTHPETDTEYAPRLDLAATLLSIDSTGRIDVSARGYLGGNKTGLGETAHTVDFANGAQQGNGGSYGGLGGHYSGSGTNQTNQAYGSLTDPMNLGSGGGAYAGAGGDGGGRIFITAQDIIVEGSIMANGGLSSGSASGEGSGGTINIRTQTLAGTGNIEANGGSTGGTNHTAGGGGRIAVRYQDSLSLTLPVDNIRALGGDGQYADAGHGSIYLKTISQTYGDLIIDGANVSRPDDMTIIPGGMIFDNIDIRNSAHVISDEGIAVVGTLKLSNGGILSHTSGNESGLQIIAGRVEVESGSAIDTSGRGYAGGNLSGFGETAATLDNLAGSANGCGGSYGGQGAWFNGSSGHPNRVYGNPAQPDLLGSGGGAYSGNGGHGGGYVHIIASQAVVVDGNILANGGISSGSASGEGSGGSVWIETSQLSGNGYISANGGSTSGTNHTSGGGGRVAVYVNTIDAIDNLNNLYNITAFSGLGNYDNLPSAAGTVFVKYDDQDYGNLIIDDNFSGTTAPGSTRLPLIGPGFVSELSDDSLTGDGLVTWPVNGLAGLMVNPNVDQDETFKVLSNTADTLVVETPNKNGIVFADVAAEDTVYTGVFTYDNILFRRGGNLEAGDPIAVTDTVEIIEYGMLAHPETDAVYKASLELITDMLIIDSTGRIDVTGRGYLGGNKTGLGETAHTLDFNAGAQAGNGGSYGGLGGHFSGSGTYQPNPVYGNYTDPMDLGSGGGAYSGAGGDGGGRIFITAQDIIVDGSIIADGEVSVGSASGDGSGGTINIQTLTLDGAGYITANGGTMDGTNHTGGGGGRIAVRYQGSQGLGLPIANIQSLGGDGYYGDGEDGTVYLEEQF